MAEVSQGEPGGLALFTDLYELMMVQAYLREGMTAPAVFELFFRELPAERNFVMAAGLAPLLDALEGLQFSADDLEYLRADERFSEEFLHHLADFRFTGDVWAVPEGTLVFPHEPLVQVVAPLPEAQLIETLVLNQIHFASLAATKAARIVLAAGGRRVIDFGSRRAHGIDAGMIVARSAYLAGCDGTSLMAAGRRYGIPIFGTMAHSYIQAHGDELAAFASFLDSFPESTLLVDTYDTIEGVQKVVELRRKMGDRFRVRAIRLDSGDLVELSRQSRRILDDAGLQHVQIVASGGLDEYKLAQFAELQAPIDGYGVGTSLAVSSDAPALDMAYKLVEYDGRPRTKLSSSKVIYPGRKQIFRQTVGSAYDRDVLAPAGAKLPGEGLLKQVVRKGQRMAGALPNLCESRDYAAEQLRSLPEPLRQLTRASSEYTVDIASELESQLNALRQQHL